MNPAAPKPALLSDLLIMPDGRILARNLTPEMAAVLDELQPDHAAVRRSVVTKAGAQTRMLLPPAQPGGNSTP
jgi:hypothetical protein